MSRTIYQCELSEIRDLTQTVRELNLKIIKPKGFKFAAGQFVMLHFNDPISQKIVQRAYSIGSSHHSPDQFKLIIKILPGGKASTLVSQLRGKEVLQMTGPFGRHLFSLPAPPKVFFLCTGAGISQHISYLLSHTQEISQSTVKLMMGVWNEGEIFYRDELDKIAKNLKSFSYEYVLDSAESQWQGRKGYLHHHLDSLGISNSDSIVYLCGNPDMIKSFKEELEKRSFPPGKIIAESFNH